MRQVEASTVVCFGHHGATQSVPMLVGELSVTFLVTPHPLFGGLASKARPMGVQACLAKTMGNVRRRFSQEFETNSWNRKRRLILFFAEDNARRCYRPFFFVTPKPFLAVFSRFIFELDIGDSSIPNE